MKLIANSVLLFSMILMMQGAAEAKDRKLDHAPGIYAGSSAPDFTAKLHDGSEINLYETLLEGPVVLVFYRGAWCPFCNIHLRQFEAKAEEIRELGARILAISVDLEEYAGKTKMENTLSFDVVSDPNAAILTEYNLLFMVPAELNEKYKNEYGLDLEKHSGRTDGALAVPATYVIDTDGTVVFAYANTDYKTRTSPEEVISVLENVI